MDKATKGSGQSAEERALACDHLGALWREKKRHWRQN